MDTIAVIGVILATIYFVVATYNLVTVIKKKYFDAPILYKPNQSQHLRDDQPIHNSEDIELILADITFKPSCVDMNWKWQVRELTEGFLIRTSFRRPERDSGKVAEGFGRWWYVPEGVTLSGVVKTAYKAALLILEHELMESFKWRGKRVFNPHNSVVALASLSEED